MAQTKVEEGAAAETAAQPKPRRRITRRKVVEQHARSYFDALSRRDANAMARYWSEDGVADIVALGIVSGPHEISALFRELFAALPDLETTVTRVVAGEREASVEWRMTGHFSGASFQGVEATGKRVELRGVDVLEIENGKNLTNTAYYDGMSFARQIGLMPPLDSGPERALKSAFNASTKLRRALDKRRTSS